MYSLVKQKNGFIVFFMFSFELFCLFSVSFCFVLCFRLVCLSFCIYNRTNIYNNINKTEQLEGKHTTKTEKHGNLPARPLEIFIFRGGSWAGGRVEGWISCIVFVSIKKTQSKLNQLFCLISGLPCLFLVNSSKSYHICFTQVNTLTTTKYI